MFQFNASMRIHGRILLPVFGNKLASIFGRCTPSAIDNFYRAVSHHKGKFDFCMQPQERRTPVSVVRIILTTLK